MDIIKYRITFRGTKGKPGFKDVLASQVYRAVQNLTDKGYTMVVINPEPHIGKCKSTSLVQSHG